MNQNEGQLLKTNEVFAFEQESFGPGKESLKDDSTTHAPDPQNLLFKSTPLLLSSDKISLKISDKPDSKIGDFQNNTTPEASNIKDKLF